MAEQFYEDVNGQVRWRVRANNNRNLGNSGEGYHNRIDAVRGLLRLIELVDVDTLRKEVTDYETRTAQARSQKAASGDADSTT